MQKRELFVIFLLSLFLCLPLIANPILFFERGNDLQEFFWPIILLTKKTILNYHTLPFWNWHILAGTPLLPDPQSFLFYIPNVIFLIFPKNTAFTLAIIGHITLAGVSMYLLAKKGFGLSSSASIIAAFLYMSSSRLAAAIEAGHVGLIFAWGYIPLTFWAVKGLYHKPSKQYLFILILSFWGIFTSHILTFLLCLGFSLIFFIYLCLQKRPTLKSYIFVAIGLMLFLGVSSVTLLPQLTWQSQTTRRLLTLTREVHPIWNSKIEFIKAVVNPMLWGNKFAWSLNTEKWLAIGIFPLIISLVVFLKASQRVKGALIVAGLVILLISLNNASPLYNLFIQQDQYVLLRVTTRVWFIVSIVTSLLVGFFYNSFSKTKFVKLIVALTIIESSILFFRYLAKPVVLPPKMRNSQLLQQLSEEAKKEEFRIYCTTRCISQDDAVLYNIKLIDGYSTLQQLNYFKQSFALMGGFWNYYSLSVPPIGAYIFDKPQPNAASLAEYATKYVISPYKLTDNNLIQKMSVDGYDVYQNVLYKPGNYEFINPNRIVTYDANIPIVYNPGWKAYQSGREILIQERPNALMLIDTKGEDVELVYSPGAFKLGALITFVSIIVILLI